MRYMKNISIFLYRMIQQFNIIKLTQINIDDPIDIIEDDIIIEENQRLMKLNQELSDLQFLQIEYLNILCSQGENINKIEKDTDKTNINTQIAIQDIKDTSKMSYGPALIAGTTGFVIGGPIGLVIGVKFGLIAGISSGIIGGIVGKYYE